ncbi:MAG TPA: F0F1 ATP synthase subunit alpha [Actinomycetota bacterium]|nr:F0F1 ATP synthase subunit alpha [Actinomycetota bacterium]
MAVTFEDFDPSEIAEALRKHVEGWTPSVVRGEVGRVIEAGDGIARVAGLPRAMANELLEFPEGIVGLAFNLDVDEIGCIILGESAHIEEGDQVTQTGKILSVPVGDGFLGRVVNALGEPIDDLGPIQAEDRRNLEVQAPNVVNRQPVKEPLYTGITAIDAMTAIGRGQRELIIGDRQTGKTAVAIDAIIAQKEQWATGDPKRRVKCIYVAVGQKSSTVAEVVETLRVNGALEYTVIVNAPASDPAPFQYIAPYSGAAFGAHWMYRGEHALIVYDDLSKQATAYRTLSLLLRRPPGREAFPGDVFYLHSRLLERAAKLSDELGGGSLTALPIIETKGNDISAYIPTNVISITDGQIYLEPDLFFAGVRPAINIGVSVSRVGGNAQTKAMKKGAGRLRLDLAQYRALEAFAQFGSELDKASQQQLARGARVVEVLKQPQYRPLSVEREVVLIWTATGGYLDRFPVEDAKRFVDGFIEHLDTRTDVLHAIRESGELSDETEATMQETVAAFAETFQPTGAAAGSEAARGAGTPPDEVRPDVGWDRMSSVDDEDEGSDGSSSGREPRERSPQEVDDGPSLAEEDDVQGQVPLPGDGDED